MIGRIATQRIFDRVRDERGSALVEFAISALLLFTLLFGIIDFCRAMYSYHFVTYAAQEGSRYAIVRGQDSPNSGSCSTSAPPNFTLNFRCVAQQSDVQNYVQSIITPLIDPAKLTVTASWPGTTPSCTSNCSACTVPNSRSCLVNVNVSYQFGFILPFLPKSAITFSGTSVKPIQQ